MDQQSILDVVAKYQKLINTQSREIFDEIFANNELCNLIAVGSHFTNRESIYNDFIAGAIKNAYSRIELISDGIHINEISEDLVTVVFKYHTDCDRRDNGEFFSISGLETQVMIRENGNWKILHIHYSKV